jgi:CheY-like chemotaxis protein
VEDEMDLLFQRLPLFANKTPASAKMHETNGHNASLHSINNGNGHNTNGHESLRIIQKEHPARKAEVCAPADADNHSPLILLVEDNEIGIEAMQDYLMAHSYRVIIARNGEEAIAQTNQCHPDLILMDIQMPDMDGLEATSRIRAQDEFTDIPIIALTALAMPGDRERCIQAGATEYLSKPVSMKQLVHVIQSQLHLEPVLAT